MINVSFVYPLRWPVLLHPIATAIPGPRVAAEMAAQIAMTDGYHHLTEGHEMVKNGMVLTGDLLDAMWDMARRFAFWVFWEVVQNSVDVVAETHV